MDELDPEIKEEEILEDDLDVDDVLIPGKKKPKIKDDDVLSLDDLTEEEEEVLPEDGFDDVDLW